MNIVVEKFAPILQKMCDLMQQCFTTLLVIQTELVLLPSLMPQQEEEGFWGKLGEGLLIIFMAAVGGIIAALKFPLSAFCALGIAILTALSYLLAWIVGPSGSSSPSAYRDEQEKLPGHENATYQNEPAPGPNKSAPDYLEASLNSKQSFAWPYAETLSAAAIVPPGMGTTNNYYSDCNNNSNNQTVNASVPPEIATPDLVAESIIRELKTLGMNYDYAIRG